MTGRVGGELTGRVGGNFSALRGTVENMANKQSDGDLRGEFDLGSLFSGPANLMSGVFTMAEGGRKTIAAIGQTIASLQRAAAAVERLATRLDALADEIERPVKMFGPEIEKATERMRRLTDAFESPIERLLPNLERAIGTLDRVAVNQLPDTLDLLREQMIAVVEGFAEIPKRFAPFGEFFPGLDRFLTPRRSTASSPASGVVPAVATTPVVPTVRTAAPAKQASRPTVKPTVKPTSKKAAASKTPTSKQAAAKSAPAGKLAKGSTKSPPAR